ncbi:hypothetical protein QQS21_002483 [Conoideocrella luteorostrata]|uniref:Uncharacterized protein n=1 Tax=Conoideocrella luteorostrata TaxID=1105319 RepID=A0AAJ0FXA4_9HYPO|nr:hypothetical protein QQS21_002483 [Conoideocrella luteorostrata]
MKLNIIITSVICSVAVAIPVIDTADASQMANEEALANHEYFPRILQTTLAAIEAAASREDLGDRGTALGHRDTALGDQENQEAALGNQEDQEAALAQRDQEAALEEAFEAALSMTNSGIYGFEGH